MRNNNISQTDVIIQVQVQCRWGLYCWYLKVERRSEACLRLLLASLGPFQASVLEKSIARLRLEEQSYRVGVVEDDIRGWQREAQVTLSDSIGERQESEIVSVRYPPILRLLQDTAPSPSGAIPASATVDFFSLPTANQQKCIILIFDLVPSSTVCPATMSCSSLLHHKDGLQGHREPAASRYLVTDTDTSPQTFDLRRRPEPPTPPVSLLSV